MLLGLTLALSAAAGRAPYPGEVAPARPKMLLTVFKGEGFSPVGDALGPQLNLNKTNFHSQSRKGGKLSY